jgi:hypothetical protein
MGLKAETFCCPSMATYDIKQTALQYNFKFKNYNIFYSIVSTKYA